MKPSVKSYKCCKCAVLKVVALHSDDFLKKKKRKKGHLNSLKGGNQTPTSFTLNSFFFLLPSLYSASKLNTADVRKGNIYMYIYINKLLTMIMTK